MNTPKPVFLMAGGRREGRRSMNRLLRSILEETGKEKPVIAYVGVASDDNWGFFQLISGMIKQAYNCQIKRVLIARKNADLDKARSILGSSDAIFMSGGDMEVGMNLLIEKDLIEYLKGLYQQGTLFFGVSAGSIMLANEWVHWTDPEDETTSELFPCLGIAPLICDTHAEEDGWEELKAALKLKADGAVGYGIPSKGCLKVSPDGALEPLGDTIVRYSLRNGKVVRQKDLLPLKP